MAMEQALQFITRVNEDKVLQGKLEAVTKDSIGEIVNIGREAGFTFTPEELQSAALEQKKMAAGEISDEALESIAGGVNGDGVAAPLPGNSYLIGLLSPAASPQYPPKYFSTK